MCLCAFARSLPFGFFKHNSPFLHDASHFSYQWPVFLALNAHKDTHTFHYSASKKKNGSRPSLRMPPHPCILWAVTFPTLTRASRRRRVPCRYPFRFLPAQVRRCVRAFSLLSSSSGTPCAKPSLLGYIYAQGGRCTCIRMWMYPSIHRSLGAFEGLWCSLPFSLSFTPSHTPNFSQLYHALLLNRCPLVRAKTNSPERACGALPRRYVVDSSVPQQHQTALAKIRGERDPTGHTRNTQRERENASESLFVQWYVSVTVFSVALPNRSE